MGADLGPNFNLTANVGSVTPSTATKSELTAGKSVSVDDAATQVTITSTGTCTNAATQTIPCAGGTTTSTTTTTTTTTAPPTSTLYVYAKEVGASGNLILYAGVNGGAGTTIYDESIDGNMSTVVCGLIYTFVATLAPGDTVTFSTSQNCVMAGDDSVSCPSATGSGTTFTTAYMVAGQNYVALGLNSSINP
jgi:hypothetical protein